MCGIAGYWTRGEKADAARLRAMCGSIRHRGPDDEGAHLDGGCAIGMRRLSIIDLTTGHQPISNEDASIWIVFNGEIYEYQQLRHWLAARGHRFRTQSDTEAIVHLYEEEGTEGFARLRGMFAFAIWDSPRQKLVLARDRFGKKPLYYSALSTAFYFGSEIKCLRAAGVPLDVDQDALKLYFQFNYIPDPHSAFRHIRKLAPGCWLTVESDGSLREGRYWKLPAPNESAEPVGVLAGLSRDAVRTRVRDAFDEAVRIRMVADVPLGAFLSGGIDSSSVVASMALQSAEPVKTFSIGFEESRFNELPWAAQVARQYRTDHHEIVVHPDSLALVQRLVRHFDEPFGDSSAIPTFIVSEFAARYVKVVLTGDGGDEMFGGYESFFQIERRRRLDLLPGPVRRILDGIARTLPYSAYGKNFLYMISRATPLERYMEGNSAHWFLRQRMLQPAWMLRPGEEATLREIFPDCLLPEAADVLTQALYFEATAKLSGDMLVKVDRMSMANSLEVRCPLLDHPLAELAASIPHAWKIDGGQGKKILIEAIGGRLPAELLRRPKMGFGVPLAAWFRGSLREFLWDHIGGGRFFERGIVSPDFVTAMLREHQSGRRDNNHWLWALLMLELWFREVEQVPIPAAGTLT
jgi:asparagine synthase (glutamine-hydrolysing)